MGRISPAQVAGLDLIDKLFFNQVLVACLFTEELVWMQELDADIESALTGMALVESRRQMVKHAVLCILEVWLSDSLLLAKDAYLDRTPPMPEGMTVESFEAVEEYRRLFLGGFFLAMMSTCHGSPQDEPAEIAESLVGKYRNAPATFRYRLADRMLALNFPVAPIDAFAWLSRMGVLDSGKHRGENLIPRYSEQFLQRLAWLCEFDLLREHVAREMTLRGGHRGLSLDQIRAIHEISAETKGLLLARMKKELELQEDVDLRRQIPFLPVGELGKSASVRRFFTAINTHGVRCRTFRGSLASWIGMLCGGFVEVLLQNESLGKPIYVAEFNDGSLTHYLADGMKARGFAITARVIYERHRDFRETVLRAVRVYYELKLAENVALPCEVKDTAYEAICWQVDMLKPSPRRASRAGK